MNLKVCCLCRDDWQRIEMYQCEIEKLNCLFPERSSEFVASLFSCCDWFSFVGQNR